MDAQAGFPLRALGIGEIFDRAITIYVRNFVVFTLIVLTALVPLAIVQYFVLPDQSAEFAQAIYQIQHPTTKPPKNQGLASLSPAQWSALLATIGLALLTLPLANCAIAVGVAAVYFGKRPDYRTSYETVLRRWPSIVATVILQGLIVFGVYLAGVVALGMLVVIGALLASAVLPLSIIVFLLAAVGFFALLVLLIVLIIASTFAVYAVALENVTIRRAIAESFARIFDRKELGKAALMGLAIAAIQGGVTWLSLGLGVLFLYALKSYALELTVNALINAVATAFVTVIFAVYYFDVRTRREGLDLEADLQRLTPA